MMTSAEIKKYLKSKGAGGFWGRGIRLFDEQYDIIHKADMDSMVSDSLEKLKSEGLDPYADYFRWIADCDNWTLWLQSEVSKAWAVKNKDNTQARPLAFGRCLVPGHDLNIGITTEGVTIWNYGAPYNIDLKTIKEVEFK